MLTFIFCLCALSLVEICSLHCWGKPVYASQTLEKATLSDLATTAIIHADIGEKALKASALTGPPIQLCYGGLLFLTILQDVTRSVSRT